MHKYKQIPKTKKLLKIFEARVERGEGGGCWEWTGTKQVTGYGSLRYNKGLRKNFIYLAHRVSFRLFKDELLKNGLVVDHICRNRLCVNPSHLRQLSINENAQRDVVKKARTNYSSPSLLFRGKCNYGHPINSFDDLKKHHYIKKKNIYYSCKFCNKKNTPKGGSGS